jgi:hypothetical protein
MRMMHTERKYKKTFVYMMRGGWVLDFYSIS